LFDRQGYHATSVTDIAEAVGLRKPSLYHYVASKQEILFLIHEALIDGLLEAVERRERERVQPGEAVLGAMTDILRLMHDLPGYARVFFENLRELSDDDRATSVRKRERYLRQVERQVAGAIEDGTFRHGDVRMVTLALLGMCNWAYQWYRPTGTASPERVAHGFWSLLLADDEPARRVGATTLTDRLETMPARRGATPGPLPDTR
jgi:TetR/AcrR family transcriptional regulator, cholesterol catabolism regulator